jgi:hypothetical protein
MHLLKLNHRIPANVIFVFILPTECRSLNFSSSLETLILLRIATSLGMVAVFDLKTTVYASCRNHEDTPLIRTMQRRWS